MPRVFRQLSPALVRNEPEEPEEPRLTCFEFRFHHRHGIQRQAWATDGPAAATLSAEGQQMQDQPGEGLGLRHEHYRQR